MDVDKINPLRLWFRIGLVVVNSVIIAFVIFLMSNRPVCGCSLQYR